LIFVPGNLGGNWDFFCGSLLHDQASLNKMVLLPWDCWWLMLSETLDNPNELEMFDEVSALTASDGAAGHKFT
jgi:hypothetical protein